MRRAAAATFTAWIACASALASDGPAPAIFGARGPVALPAAGDPQSAFRMPSGIGWSLEHQVDLDLVLAYYRSGAKNALNDLTKEGFGAGASLGLIYVPDPDGMFTFHVGVYPELGAPAPARTHLRNEVYPGIGLRGDTMFVTAAGSVVVTPLKWLSFGLSLHVSPGMIKHRLLLGGTGQKLDLAGSPTINGVALPGSPTYAEFFNLVPAVPTDPSLVYEAHATTLHLSTLLSVTLFPTENFAVGLAYRPRSFDVMPFKGDASIEASATVNGALGGLSPQLRELFLATLPDRGSKGFSADYDLEQEGPWIPQSVRLSMAWWPVPSLLLAGEVAWTDWHGAFGETTIKLTNGSNTDFNFVVGSNSVTVRAPTRWKSQWTFSAQASWTPIEELTLRGGLHYGETPMNTKVMGGISSPALACTAIYAGAGVMLTSNVQLNGLVEWALPVKINSGPGTGGVSTENTTYFAQTVMLHLGLSVWF